jgi:hypothetical protein
MDTQCLLHDLLVDTIAGLPCPFVHISVGLEVACHCDVLAEILQFLTLRLIPRAALAPFRLTKQSTVPASTSAASCMRSRMHIQLIRVCTSNTQCSIRAAIFKIVVPNGDDFADSIPSMNINNVCNPRSKFLQGH